MTLELFWPYSNSPFSQIELPDLLEASGSILAIECRLPVGFPPPISALIDGFETRDIKLARQERLVNVYQIIVPTAVEIWYNVAIDFSPAFAYPILLIRER